MDDLISRAAAIAEVKKARKAARTLTGFDMVWMLESQPAVDAVPVVHAYWKGWTATHWNKRYQDNGDPEYVEHTYYSCSECRRRTVIRENYCPNCGARMNGRNGE